MTNQGLNAERTRENTQASVSARLTPWSRLQALSCEHAQRIYMQIPRKERLRLLKAHQGPPVPIDIAENCSILKRGDDAELKYRVHWYITYHPAIFDACAKVWNAREVSA